MHVYPEIVTSQLRNPNAFVAPYDVRLLVRNTFFMILSACLLNCAHASVFLWCYDLIEYRRT